MRESEMAEHDMFEGIRLKDISSYPESLAADCLRYQRFYHRIINKMGLDSAKTQT